MVLRVACFPWLRHDATTRLCVPGRVGRASRRATAGGCCPCAAVVWRWRTRDITGHHRCLINKEGREALGLMRIDCVTPGGDCLTARAVKRSSRVSKRTFVPPLKFSSWALGHTNSLSSSKPLHVHPTFWVFHRTTCR